MPAFDAPHGRIAYEIEGGKAADPIVLITGLGAQLIRWSPALLDRLTAHGLRVIRLDNRDAGLSKHHDDAGHVSLKAVVTATAQGQIPDLPYTLHDMAGDIVTLLDALGIARAHIVGTSMGGYIAQHVAFSWPDRVKSLTLIMTSTGNPAVPSPRPEILAMLAERSRAGADRDTVIAHNLRNQGLIGSPGYPFDREKVRARIAAELDRGASAQAYNRQRAAILADGDRSDRLRGVSAPTLILHGDSDPLVDMEGSRDLARVIPGSKLVIYPGMGHEIPDALVDTIVDAVIDHARSADVQASGS